MESSIICYTGIGAKENGNHTQEEYLNVMNKHFKKKCAVYMKSLKCKSCKKSIKMNSKEVKKQIKAQIKNKTYKMSKQTENKLLRQMTKCKRCKNKNTKKCTLKNYIVFSGAEHGKCEEL